MSKFKVGDRVRNLAAKTDLGLAKGTLGTVDQDNSPNPFVIWDKAGGGRRWAQNEDKMELVTTAPTTKTPAAHKISGQWSDCIYYADGTIAIEGETKTREEWHEELKKLRRILGRKI